MRLDCAGKPLDLSSPGIMGILNVTPDSFSDGGDYFHSQHAVERALEMERDGAAVIDIGGESTRPGAEPVSLEEELRRVIPVIEALAPQLSIPISIDTQKAEVMRVALQAGAGFINDVNALRSTGTMQVAAQASVPICLMHMHGNPENMQNDPDYQQVSDEVIGFLRKRVTACQQAGIDTSRLLLDPGFGFGKTLAHNLQLLSRLNELVALGFPVLVGLSRKSMIGKMLDLDVKDRLPASIAMAVMAVTRGASLIRTHDVAATWQAVQMCNAVQQLD